MIEMFKANSVCPIVQYYVEFLPLAWRENELEAKYTQDSKRFDNATVHPHFLVSFFNQREMRLIPRNLVSGTRPKNQVLEKEVGVSLGSNIFYAKS